MLRISNTVIGVLNILTLLLGVFAVGGSTHIHIHGANATDCEKAVRYPLLIGGFLVVAVSVLGIVGSLYHVNVAMYIYILLMVLFIVGLIAFAISVELATNKEVRQKVMRHHDANRLEFYSDRLLKYVLIEKNWHVVKSCLMDVHLCRNLPIDGSRKNHTNIFSHWSRPQSGCCKPPVYCGLRMKNTTYWEVAERGAAVEDLDCKRWSNEENKLCYDCNSCKGGVFYAMNNHLKHLNKFNTCMLILITTIYVLACYAMKNNWFLSKHRNYRTQTSNP